MKQKSSWLSAFKKSPLVFKGLWLAGFLAIMMGIFILMSQPGKGSGEDRNEERSEDINILLEAIYQYAEDHNGEFPGNLTTEKTEICLPKHECIGLIDLSILTKDEKYLEDIPVDPLKHSANGTGYEISKTENGRIMIDAPHAEQGETICITR